MNEPSTLGDGEFPPKVFYWRSEKRSVEWIEKHNPYPKDSAQFLIWAAQFHLDQIAGQYSWKRSNLHRVGVVVVVVGVVVAVVFFPLTGAIVAGLELL